MANNFQRINKGITLAPQATDPSTPVDGDFYFSDGTIRAVGLWQYKSGAWVIGGSGSGGIVSEGASSTKTADYTVLSSDKGKVINVDSTSNPVTITLPAVVADFNVTIKDVGGVSATNNIIILTSDATKIDGIAGLDFIKTNYNSISFTSDGTDWVRVAYFNGAAPVSRMVVGTGYSGVTENTLEYFNMTAPASSVSFGALSTTGKFDYGTCASRTRGIIAAGGSGSLILIEYITFAITGNSVSFGNLTVGRVGAGGCSSSTRGLFGGGYTSTYVNIIDYISIASTGNAIDFGDLTVSREAAAALASPTRGVWSGGQNNTTYYTTIDYVTIATTGNATSFGNITQIKTWMAGCSSSTRGLIGGGYYDPGAGGTYYNHIEYLTIATTANSATFGTLTEAKMNLAAASSTIKGFFAGGRISGGGGHSAVLEQVTIATLGNGANFGSLLVIKGYNKACSNGHGGL